MIELLNKLKHMNRGRSGKTKARAGVFYRSRHNVPRQIRFLREELEDCVAYLNSKKETYHSRPRNLNADIWVYRNLAPFFKPPMKRDSSQADLKKLRKKGASTDEVVGLIGQIENVAWQDLANFLSQVPGAKHLRLRRPTKRENLTRKLREEEAGEDFNQSMKRIEADRIKKLCNRHPKNLPMNPWLVDLLECHILRTTPEGLPPL